MDKFSPKKRVLLVFFDLIIILMTFLFIFHIRISLFFLTE